MDNDVRVQRNDRDVALELMKLYCEQNIFREENGFAKQYAEFYALSTYLSLAEPDQLKELIPQEILSKIARY